MFAQTTGRKPGWYVVVLGFPTVSKPRATDEQPASTRWEDYDKVLVQFGNVCLFRDDDADEVMVKLRWIKAVFVDHRTDGISFLTPTAMKRRRAVKRLAGERSWDRASLRICIGDPRNLNGAVRGTASESSVVSRSSDVWTDMKSRQKNLKRNVLEKVGKTARCPGREQDGNLSEECQKQIEKETIETGDVIDTEAVKTNTHTAIRTKKHTSVLKGPSRRNHDHEPIMDRMLEQKSMDSLR